MNPTLQKIFPYLIILILAWVLLAKGCNSTPSFSEPRIVYKTKIVRWEKDKDSTKAEIKKEDIKRGKLTKRWNEVKHDTLYLPCEELILVCDSIIVVDSSEIASLKHVTLLQDSIIGTQKKVIQQDSCEIVGLKKDNKKHKRHKAFLTTGLIIVGSAAVLK